MKQVTMESVKQRINELTSTGIVSLRGEFELACLCQLVAVTEQRDALVAEAAALKSGDLFFSYGSEHGFEWHKTAKEAAENAEAAIDDYRGDACDGWPEEVSSICWGVIMQSSTMVGERPRNEDDSCDPSIDTVCDYALLPVVETPATDAEIAALRAEAIEKCADDMASENNIGGHEVDAMYAYARQLRDGDNN
ncbi:MAG: hypothetical protein E7L09_05940 [Enterobacteriaceae bacterium]|nr:hypothetical protein [Enterobacteriaceae bacterium]